MKTAILKYPIVGLVLVFTSLSVNCQGIYRFVRGHFEDDLYVYTATQNPPNSAYLIYLTEDGSKLSVQNYSYLFFGAELTAEPDPGVVVGHSDQYFGQSFNYGNSFFMLPPFVNSYTSILGLFGGEVPGEYIIDGYDISVHPHPARVIYITSDYFYHYTLVQDSCNGIYYGEVGHVSGELFQVPIINQHSFLTHSLDFGLTSDTIPIDTTILNLNEGLIFKTLSRGSAQGELFLITQQNISLKEIRYSIYHSTDYGINWQLKNCKVFDSENQQFTAGRGACKFYIANLQDVEGSTYCKLQIFYSSDCGETFTTFEYILTPDVGVQEGVSAPLNKVEISPNPASQTITLDYQISIPSVYEIAFYNSPGQCVLQTEPSWETGTIKKTINIEGLKQGFYTVQIQSAGSTIATGKLIISR